MQCPCAKLRLSGSKSGRCFLHQNFLPTPQLGRSPSPIIGIFLKLDANSFLVNARLAGEKSEDPKFPKIQYPSNEECALCKTADDFEMEETLKYLDYRYSKENLVLADGEKMVDNSRMEDDSDEVVEAIIEKPK